MTILENNHSNTSASTRLRAWRERRGISQDEMADALGYHIVSIAQYLTGSKEITDRFIGTFTRVYGPRAASEAFGLELEPLITE